MPGFDDELQEALGGGARGGFDDELSEALKPADDGFKPYAGPAQIPITDADRRQVNGNPYASLIDAGRGLAQGALGGGADNLVGLIRGADEGDIARLQDRESRERSPWLYGSMQALGALPRNMATGLYGSLAQGAVEGVLGADPTDIPGALRAAAGGLITNGALHVAGSGIVTGANSGAGALRSAGVAARRANVGGSEGELDALRKQHGIDYMQSGLDQRFDELGLASRPWPQSAADVYRRIGPEPGQQGMMAREGARMGGAMDEAQALGIRGDWQNVDDAMRNRTNTLLTNAPEPSAPTWRQADELYRIRSEELPPPGPMGLRDATPRELHAQKMEFEDAGKYPEGTVANLSESNQPLAYRGAATDVRNELRDVMANAGPDINREFTEGAENYGDLAGFAAMAGRRASQNKATSMFSNPWTYGSSAAGAAIGGGMLGPLGALGGGLIGGAFGRKYGQDIAGLGLMGAAHGVRGLGQLGSLGLDAVSSAATQGAGRAAAAQPDLTDAALNALQYNRQALGPYAGRLAEAAGSPEPGAVSALIARLIQTDPEFRTRVLPQLRAAGGPL